MIDELLHFCIEQIGLDGEAGTDVDRFADFIRQYHTEHSSRSKLPDQLVDLSYQAFVFRQLLRHPDVSVGLFVPGVPLKTGAKTGILKRKASVLDTPDTPAAETKSKVDSGASQEFDWVDLLPNQNLAEQQGLIQLQQLYSDRLRLVLQAPLIKRLIVGSNADSLTASGYRALQIICRSREKPVLSTDIGAALHTDQKTVFYICKRLIDLHLVTKIKARETGTAASYFVATQFEHQCDILVRQRRADNATDLQQSSLAAASTGQPTSSAHPISSLEQENPIEDNDEADLDDDEGDAAGQGGQTAPTVTVKEEESTDIPDAGVPAINSSRSVAPVFDHVEPAQSLLWINSRPELVRFRIYLVCNATSSRVTVRVGLLQRINLTETRPQRRAFHNMLEHAVVDGFLEVVNVLVPSTGRTLRGLRMTNKGLAEMNDLLRGDYGDATLLQEQVKAARLNTRLQQDLDRVESTLPRELTLERHVYEHVARAGPAGRTISQLLSQLHSTGHFARALDQLAQRAEGADGEPAMGDMHIRSFHEHKLRVRSTKLYSHHSWVLQSANEGYLDTDDLQLLAAAGGSTVLHRKSTAWTTADQVESHLAFLGRDLYPETPGVGASRRGRPPKTRDPDAPTPKRGRPRKHPLPDPDTPAPPPKKRGRPRKNPVESADTSLADTETLPLSVTSSSRRTTRSAKARESDLETGLIDAQVAEDDAMDEDKITAIPDSPAAAALTSRTRRLLQEHEQAESTSQLASSTVANPSPITPTSEVAVQEAVASPIEQATVPEPIDLTEPATQPVSQQATRRDSMRTPSIKEADTGTEGPSLDVSRVGDLLAASSDVKKEAMLPATPAAKTLSRSTATPSASERKRRTNLTQLRSSHALVQCVREAGGAMDALSIPDQLSDFVERHGFASDTQLTNLRDRKVREKALIAAVDNNLLRRTFIRLDRPTAPIPRRQIIHLPDLDPEQLHNYCEAVKQGRDGWFDSKTAKTALTHATNDVAVDGDDALRFAKPWHLTPSLRLNDLLADPSHLTLLRQTFRDVTSVYRQHFGFLAGEMIRLKAFHHGCAKFIALRREASSGSDNARCLPLSYFWTEAPLDLFLALVPTPPVSEAVERIMLDPLVRSASVDSLSEDLKASLGLAGRVTDEVRFSLYSLAMQLSDLGIVSLRGTNIGKGQSNTNLDILSTTIEPLSHLPLYDWASEEPRKPLIGLVEAGLDTALINRFWAKTQARCLNAQKGIGTEGLPAHGVAAPGDVSLAAARDSGVLTDVESHKSTPEELVYVMYYSKAWRPYHSLRPSQQKFLNRIDVRDIASATQDDLDRLAYVTFVPSQVVHIALQYRLKLAAEPVDPDVPVARRKSPHFSWPLRLSTVSLPTSVYRALRVQTDNAETAQSRRKTQAEREKEGRLTTYIKARQLRERREQDFQAMLDQAFSATPAAHELRAKIETAVAVIRRKFVYGDVKFDVAAVQTAIARAIRSASGIRMMPIVRTSSAGRTRRRDRPLSTSREKDSGDDSEQQQGLERDADTIAGKSRGKRDRRRRRNVDQVNFWTPAKKELLRDAAVILRVRDQVRGRSDWSALFQVMDREDLTKTRSVLMAQWRNQYYRMRSLHGEEAYLTALESRWIPVYLDAREDGTLLDSDFPSPTDFDLVAQIELLRAKIDKDEVQRSLTKPIARHHLPLTLGADSDFIQNWKEEFVEEPVEQRFEAFFPSDFAGATTKRLETLLNVAFGEERLDPQKKTGADIASQVAEWAVRIVVFSSDPSLGSCNSVTRQSAAVDERRRAEFCNSIGDTEIEEAMQRLLDVKLIRCTSVDPTARRRPGTNFIFTEELHKLLPDPNAGNKLAAMDLQATLTHRKPAFQQVCEAEDGVIVEPVEADGEAAAMVPLLACELMAGEIDVRAFDALRQNAAFNARVLNDDDLEAFVTIKGRSGMMEALDAAVVSLPAVPADEAVDWLRAAKIDTAKDPRLSRAVVETMLEIWRPRLEDCIRDISATDTKRAKRLEDFGLLLIGSDLQGLAVDDGAHQLAHEDIVTYTRGPLPLAFFSPLTSRPVLVASIFVEAYTLCMSTDPKAEARFSLPHIWTSLTGPSVTQWRSLLETIVALVFQRPGMQLGWLPSRFSTQAVADSGEEKEVVGTSFHDLWSAVSSLVEVGVIDLRGEGRVGGWTLHPGTRSVWAGFC